MNALKFAVFISCLAVFLAAGTSCKEQSEPGVVFPQTNEVSGWTKSGEARTFAASELSKYIDGDAEKYLKAGVRSASTSDYRFSDQTQAVADVYTMSTVEGAKSIFEAEPAVGAGSATIGDVARLYSQSLVFRKGRYLVRIVAYQVSPNLEEALLDLGRGIEKKLPQ